MASRAWRERFELARVTHLTRVLSDQCALWTEWVVNVQDGERQRRWKRFRFETMWLDEKECTYGDCAKYMELG